MSAQTAVILGLGTVFAGLVWISFKLNESDSELTQYIGMLFLALGIGVLQIVGVAAMEIAANNSMAYISNDLTTPILWVLNIAMFVYWISLLLRVFYFFTLTIIDVIKRHFGGQVS